MLLALKYGVPVALVLLIAAYFYGRQQENAIGRVNQLEDRIKTKDAVRGVDNEVFNADKRKLCDLLGGCELPSEQSD